MTRPRSLAGLGLAMALACALLAQDAEPQVSIRVNRVIQIAATGLGNENCQALRDVLAGITDGSFSNRYVVRLEPGQYSCGSQPVLVPEGVALQGMGNWRSPQISGTVDNPSLGVLHLESHTGLRNLQVVNSLITPSAGGIAVSAWSFAGTVTGVRLREVSLLGADNVPDNHALRAVNAEIRAYRSALLSSIELSGGATMHLAYSALGSPFLSGGASISCSFSTFFTSGDPLDDGCQP